MTSDDILRQDFEQIAALTPWREMAGSRVLVTGAAGFIGSYLLAFLKFLNTVNGANISIYGVDNFVSGIGTSLYAPLIRADISSTADLVRIPACDFVFHLASIAAPSFYLKHPIETIDVNIIGTRNMLKKAHSAKRFCHFSSCEVYGNANIDPVPEDYTGSVPFGDHRSVYNETKRVSETICMAQFRQNQMPVVIVRPFNVYGPMNRLDDGRVVPNLVRCTLTGEPFHVYDNKMSRSYVYVGDAIIQVLALTLCGTPGEAYNVGDDRNDCTALVLAQAMRQVTGARFEIKTVEKLSEGMAEAPKSRRPDMRKTLKIAAPPQVSMGTGLRRTYDWNIRARV